MKKAILVVVLVLIILAGLGYFLFFRKRPPSQTTVATSQTTPKSVEQKWQEGGVAIAGKYADADIVDLGSDKWRMYYSVEPEVAGNKLELYSSVSADGKNWTQEEGVRKEFATFPSVLKLADGRWRLYFQNAGVIKSAISEDGLDWTDEAGVRIDANEDGLSNIENVGAQTVTVLDNGSFLMVYRVMLPEKYSAEVPNNTTQILYYASSVDGLSWQKKGLALDSRNDTFYGLIDGAELVKWDPSTLQSNSGQASSGQVEIRLYFWSYKGIYHLTFENGIFSQEPDFDFTTGENGQKPFPPNPPGDPTLAKIQGKWYLYYGQHEKGIYYAVYQK